MAVKWNVDNIRRNVYYFDTADIKFKPELNGRAELPDIEELKASILEYGQLQPVVVRSENDMPVLIMGFSRWRAITELNKDRTGDDRIKIAAVYERCNEQEAFVRNWEENRRRKETTALDDAHHFDQLERWGWDAAKIAQRFKVTPKFVSDRLTLIQAEPEVQVALKEKRINTSAAVKLAKLASDQQRKVVKGNGKVSDVEIATATNTTIKPNLKQVKDFITIRMAQAGQTESVRKFCDELLDYINGKVS
jgi:ParB family transcriptional regulator, chromosome partitioning protein